MQILRPQAMSPSHARGKATVDETPRTELEAVIRRFEKARRSLMAFVEER